MSVEKLYYGYEDMHADIEVMAAAMKYEQDLPDLVVGITRGGLVPAVVFSHLLNVPLKTIEVSFRDSGVKESCAFIIDAIRNGKRVLVVDDICDSGETLEWIRNEVRAFNIQYPEYMRFAVLIHNEGCQRFEPDYCGVQDVNKSQKDVWIVFPWEQ